jgi:hypothetical protein
MCIFFPKFLDTLKFIFQIKGAYAHEIKSTFRRNNACFRFIRPDDPIVVTNMTGQLVSSWAILQVKEASSALKSGARLFVQLSNESFRASKGWWPSVRRLTD